MYAKITGKDDQDGLGQMRRKFAFFRDFQNLFAEENPQKIQAKVFPEIVEALVTQPLIFSEASHLEIFDAYSHIVTLQLRRVDRFDAEHTKGYKPLTRSEVLEQSRAEAQKLREDLVKKNADREARIKKEKIRLEKELARKAKEDAMAAKKAAKEARLAAIREARQQKKQTKPKKEAPNSGEENDEVEGEEEGDEQEEDADIAEEPEDEPEEAEDEEQDQNANENPEEEDQEDEENPEGQEDPENAEGKTVKIDEYNLLDPNLFVEPIENLQEVSFSYNGELYYFEYSIKGNSKLEEYFTTLKKGLRSSVLFGRLAFQSLLTPYSVTMSDSLEKVASLLPVVSKILLSPNLTKEKRTDSLIRNKLKDLSVISANIGDLVSLIAKGMSIVRRDTIAHTGTLSPEEIQALGPLVYAGLKDKKLTDLQILAVLDCKYVEASCLRNLAEKNWTAKEKPSVRIVY